jgi:hypothetical protein
MMKAYRVALVAASAGALVVATQSPAQLRTTAPPAVAPVKVTITDARISLSTGRAQRGTYARFLLVNIGKRPHTFTIGHTKHATGQQTGFKKALRPNETAVVLLFLDYRGELPYFSSHPADRSKPGMKGIFRII